MIVHIIFSHARSSILYTRAARDSSCGKRNTPHGSTHEVCFFCGRTRARTRCGDLSLCAAQGAARRTGASSKSKVIDVSAAALRAAPRPRSLQNAGEAAHLYRSVARRPACRQREPREGVDALESAYAADEPLRAPPDMLRVFRIMQKTKSRPRAAIGDFRLYYTSHECVALTESLYMHACYAQE